MVKNIRFNKAKRSVPALNFMEIYQWPTICFIFYFTCYLDMDIRRKYFHHMANEIKVHIHCDIFFFVNDVDSIV